MNDESYTILLNTLCRNAYIPEKLRAFYRYVSSGEVTEGDAFIEELDRRVRKANEETEVSGAMTLEEDYRAGLKEARAAGRSEGLNEGRRSGLAEGKHDDAEKMKAMGMPEETIAQITGLSVAEIGKL